MTENANEEQFEELPKDVDDELDNEVSPNLGKVEEQDIPDFDDTVEFEGEDVYDDANN
jgi:hypothetical protein